MNEARDRYYDIIEDIREKKIAAGIPEDAAIALLIKLTVTGEFNDLRLQPAETY